MRLQPLESSFWEIADPQSALEFALRSRFTVLSPFQIISLRYAGRTHQVLVLEVAPDGPGVLIVNTDCVVNIDPPLGSDAPPPPPPATSGGAPGAVGGGRPTPLVLGATASGSALPGLPCTFSVSVPDAAVFEGSDLLVEVSSVAEAPPSAAGGAGSTLSGAAPPAASPAAGEPDLYVDAAPNRAPSLLEHRWAWNGTGSTGSVRVSDDPPPRPPLPGGAAAAAAPGAATVAAAAAAAAPHPRVYYVSVDAFGGPVSFSLTASLVPKAPPPAATPAPLSAAAAADPSSVICPTCGAAVPAARLDMHTAVCARNNVRCPAPGCGAVLRKGPAAFRDHWHCPSCALVLRESEGSKHVAISHTDLPCPHGCGAQMHLEALRAHARVSRKRELRLARSLALTCTRCPGPAADGLPPTPDHVPLLRRLCSRRRAARRLRRPRKGAHRARELLRCAHSRVRSLWAVCAPQRKRRPLPRRAPRR